MPIRRPDPVLHQGRANLDQAQVVLGPADPAERWAVEWLRWRGYGQFWDQLAREHMRTKHRRELDMQASVVDGQVHAVVDAFGVDDKFENGLDSTLTIEGPEPDGEKIEVPMQQTAPGRYEALVRLEKYGSYLLRADHARTNNKGEPVNAAVSYGHVSNPYPREYARFEPDLATLDRAASGTGGGVDPSPSIVFSAGDEKITYHEELWGRTVLAAVALFLLDLFLRRVRLFDRKFLPRRSRRDRGQRTSLIPESIR